MRQRARDSKINKYDKYIYILYNIYIYTHTISYKHEGITDPLADDWLAATHPPLWASCAQLLSSFGMLIQFLISLLLTVLTFQKYPKVVIVTPCASQDCRSHHTSTLRLPKILVYSWSAQQFATVQTGAMSN